MKRNSYVICVTLIIAAAAISIVFDLCNFKITQDETLNMLLIGIVPRIVASAAMLAVLILSGNQQILLPDLKNLHKHLLWCIPCFLVVIANFPFSALISGSAKILRSDLIALFILYCLFIGLLEELIFRGILQKIFYTLFADKPHKNILTVFVTSCVFALLHLFNLFSGATVGETFLQAGYSFLIGAMLSAVLIKTNNLWLCVFIHAAFDFGGNIVTLLGSGAFQDTCFWVLTAIAGAICFAYILDYLLRRSR